jgi:DNA-binding SARP family transcriptional activator
MSRRLLATLLCRRGEPVAVPVLLEALWADRLPGRARKTLSVNISRLRQALGEKGRIQYGGAGYSVVVEADELDALRLEELADHGRLARDTADLESAATLLEQALALWRGPAYAALEDVEVVAEEARRLEEQRSLIQEDLVTIKLDLGRHAEVVVDLAGKPDQLPYRERLCALLLIALYRAGRQVEALELFGHARTTLIEGLGVEPGPMLRNVHEAILRNEDTLNGAAQEILLQAAGVELPRRAPVPLSAPASIDPTDGTPPGLTDWDTVAPSAPLTPKMLPADIADFTGRAEQVGILMDLFSADKRPTAMPVSVVVGRAGVGKTTLAVHVAHLLSDVCLDGQLYVDLHGVGEGDGAGAPPADPAEVLARFLTALGMQPRALPTRLEERAESFRALVAGRRILVVLDNAADERQVRPLLPGSPTCAVLVTSRRRLAGLSAYNLHLEAFDPGSARALLERIAGADRISADATAATEIAELCGHLPLAIRVAGARLAAREHWSLSYLAGRLRREQGRLDELAAGDLSVRASLALGYGALTAPARQVFRLLALLEAPSFPAWIAAALLDTSIQEAETLFEELLDSGLLVFDGMDACKHYRYRFHDLVKLYALECAKTEETAGRRTMAVTRALGAWLALAEVADREITERIGADIVGTALRWWPTPPGLGAQDMDALAWFDSERLAIGACVAQACGAGLSELAWELAARMVNYYTFRGLYEDWSTTHERALSECIQAGNHLGKAVMSRNLDWLRIIGFKTASPMVLDKTEEAMATFHDLGYRNGEVDVAGILVFVVRHWGDYDHALACASSAMAMAEEAGYELGRARLLYDLAVIHREQGRYASATECAEQCFDIAGRIGTAHDRVLALWELGAACRDRDATEEIINRLRDVTDECRSRNERLLEAYLQLSLGDLYIRFGRPGARPLITSALAVFREHRVLFGQTVGFRLLGRLEAADGQPERAVSYLTKAVELAGKLRNINEQAVAFTALGHAQRGEGNREAAHRSWRKAQDLFAQISNTTEQENLTTLLK